MIMASTQGPMFEFEFVLHIMQVSTLQLKIEREIGPRTYMTEPDTTYVIALRGDLGRGLLPM